MFAEAIFFQLVTLVKGELSDCQFIRTKVFKNELKKSVDKELEGVDTTKGLDFR